MSRQTIINQILQQELSPSFLEVENESYKHHVPEGSQTHFKVIAVSMIFKDLSLVARHRLVNTLLQAEFQSGLHALSLHLYTAEEWEKKHQSVTQSPACKDGFGK